MSSIIESIELDIQSLRIGQYGVHYKEQKMYNFVQL
jgi:hypothetical protein